MKIVSEVVDWSIVGEKTWNCGLRHCQKQFCITVFRLFFKTKLVHHILTEMVFENSETTFIVFFWNPKYTFWKQFSKQVMCFLKHENKAPNSFQTISLFQKTPSVVVSLHSFWAKYGLFSGVFKTDFKFRLLWLPKTPKYRKKKWKKL